jgi:hypothetical protein
MADAMINNKWTKLPCPTCGHGRKVIAGAWLRALREAAGISLRQMAKDLGYSPAFLSDVELGRRHCPQHVLDAYERLGKEAEAA